MKTALPLLTFALLVSCQPKKIVSDDPAPEEKAAAEEKVAAQEDKPAAIDVSKTESLVGLPLVDVEAACKAAGIRCRVVEIAGKPLPVTMDFIAERLNFKVNDGKITAVTKG